MSSFWILVLAVGGFAVTLWSLYSLSVALNRALTRMCKCKHPGNMVTADILQGDAAGIEVKWCRRCGAIKVVYDCASAKSAAEYIRRRMAAEWRVIDPKLREGGAE